MARWAKIMLSNYYSSSFSPFSLERRVQGVWINTNLQGGFPQKQTILVKCDCCSPCPAICRSLVPQGGFQQKQTILFVKCDCCSPCPALCRSLVHMSQVTKCLENQDNLHRIIKLLFSSIFYSISTLQMANASAHSSAAAVPM
jgi:hypothetical protein